MVKKVILACLYQGGTVVEHSIHNPKIYDLSLDTDIRRKKTAKKIIPAWLYQSNTVVEYIMYNPKIEDSNPATSARRVKNSVQICSAWCYPNSRMVTCLIILISRIQVWTLAPVERNCKENNFSLVVPRWHSGRKLDS
jgi:hypothetical protein